MRILRTLACVVMGVAASSLPAVAGSPVRIVALAPSAAEILVALGAASRVVGISDFARDIPEVSGRVHVGGFRPDIERVLALRPDLVVVSKDGTDKNSHDQLVRLKVPILVTSGSTLEGVFSDIQSVGGAIGEQKRAHELIQVLKRRVATVRATLASRPAGRPIPTVLVLIWPDPPVVAGPSSFIGDALKQAGIPSAVPGEAGEWPRVSLETIASWNPGVIIHPETEENREVFQRAMTGNAQWKVVSAFMRGSVRSIPGAWLERPSPRLVDALERLASQLEAGWK